jgi:signal transduction histidine kinase
MDVRSNSASHVLNGPEALRFPIDHAELRSILSNLSHELCRPLVSLRAGFDLLLAEVPATISQEQRDHFLTMVALCDDLLRLTRSYLDYAALVQGSRPLSLGSFTIGALIGEIDLQFAPIARARKVEWQLRADPPDALVTTDASRCQQILGNLVSNALKYTPAGGHVYVAGKAEPESWLVTVSDSGPGIPEESQGAVFEPFYRLPREERSRIEGSGLGLAICRELVAQLDGEIGLNSALGAGTSVSVRFPRAPESTSQRGALDATRRCPPPRRESAGKRREA